MAKPSNQQSYFDPTSIRFGQRVSLELPVELTAEGRAPMRGIIRNASISGALIETPLELALHTPVIVAVPLPGPHTTAVRTLDACVVRIDCCGVGVEWRDMATIDIVELLRMHGAPDPRQ